MAYKLKKCNIDRPRETLGPLNSHCNNGSWCHAGDSEHPRRPLPPPHSTGCKKPILLVLTDMNTSFDMILGTKWHYHANLNQEINLKYICLHNDFQLKENSYLNQRRCALMTEKSPAFNTCTACKQKLSLKRKTLGIKSASQKEQFPQIPGRNSGENKIFAETNYILILAHQFFIPFQSFYQLFSKLLPLKPSNILTSYKKNSQIAVSINCIGFFYHRI